MNNFEEALDDMVTRLHILHSNEFDVENESVLIL